ncbi:hypothetical protein [Spirosoma sp.]|uniref:hypothetical protein n=1 Tax=Spirosoma sp. TaxID=1899569 RepID=UPI00260C0FA7|nr:hypothetical protein [Spirosoma sp.]MCX6215435.1 hypothetical protein [Spirosoma sp.]
MPKLKTIRIFSGLILATYFLIDYLKNDGQMSTLSIILMIVISLASIIADLYFNKKKE